MDVIMSTAESGWLVSNEVKTVCIPHNITKVIGELYVDMSKDSNTCAYMYVEVIGSSIWLPVL
ncbi:hypothetical protein TorRG33x02_006940 [Trema orientale]|uniref:Uncharacterized protein n=1 Tax=Trema orientale TaxID=63057 RepID=A0A2P5G0F4_TREOI|nr:hypothetical protein TorRG33x02_006940 [Trema orientale]